MKALCQLILFLEWEMAKAFDLDDDSFSLVTQVWQVLLEDLYDDFESNEAGGLLMQFFVLSLAFFCYCC